MEATFLPSFSAPSVDKSLLIISKSSLDKASADAGSTTKRDNFVDNKTKDEIS